MERLFKVRKKFLLIPIRNVSITRSHIERKKKQYLAVLFSNQIQVLDQEFI